MSCRAWSGATSATGAAFAAAERSRSCRRCQQPDVSVAATALARGLKANLLRKWITMASSRRYSGRSADAVLLPVRTEPSAVPVPQPADGYVGVAAWPAARGPAPQLNADFACPRGRRRRVHDRDRHEPVCGGQGRRNRHLHQC